MDSFLVTALVAGLGVAVFMAPLGAFVVWRRMAYFGDALAHSALLGVALGFLFGINANFAVIAVCVSLALALVGLRQSKLLADDTLLGILSHSALSLGLVAIAFMETLRIDLMAYLFGDILAVSWDDIAWIYGGGALALAGLIRMWRPLVAITVHEELARVEGVKAFRIQLAFMLLIAVVIAVAMKVVGVLLITALLIIPPAAARRLARTPEHMAVMAAVAGCAAVGLGLWGSVAFDAPSGPSIVVAALALFAASLAVPGITPRR